MRHGYIKCAAATVAIRLGDPAFNAVRILSAVNEASCLGAHLLVLPRMCLVGGSLGRLTGHDVVLNAAEEALQSVLRGSRDDDVLAVLTLPVRLGTGVEECAAAIWHGKILGLNPIDACGCGIATVRAFGEDLPYGDNVYCHSGVPTCKIGVSFAPGEPAAGATITAVPMATPELVGSADRRIAEARHASVRSAIVFAEAGRGESTTDYVYAGHRAIVEDGAVLAVGAPFTDPVAVAEVDTSFMYGGGEIGAQEIGYDAPIVETELTRVYPRMPFVPDGQEFAARAELILSIQAEGLATRIEKVKSRCVVIGISGGLDSALALIVAERAMRRLNRSVRDIVAVTMPCFGTSARTLGQADRLMKAFCVTQKKINVKKTVLRHFDDIGHDPAVTDAAYENAQARERTQVLMDLSNMLGGFVVGTGDLSESALGWTTYNGDHMSMYGVNASVPKTLARALVRHVSAATENKPLAKVLNDIASTPISPELLPARGGEIAQMTEDAVGPYELHDFFLYYMIGRGFTPDKVRRIALKTFRGKYDSVAINRTLRTFISRFFASQFKRNCMPDGAAVGTIGLSPRIFEMPSDAEVNAWLADLAERE